MSISVDKLRSLAKESLGRIKPTMSSFVANRIINPIKDIPNRLEDIQSTFYDAPANPTKQETVDNLKRQAMNVLGIAGAFSPGPDDVVMGAYDALKAKAAGKDATKAFTGEEFTTLGEATKNFAPEKLQRVLSAAEIPAMLAFGGLKAKNIDNVDRQIGISALRRFADNAGMKDINYAVGQAGKDEALIRELAGDYINKKFAKTAPIANVADELTNAFEMGTYRKVTPETPNNLEIPNLLKKNAEGLTPEVNPLIAEARKYKSAEDFVKAQGNPLLHGTDAKFNEFDLSKRGINEKDFQSKNSVFFTDSMDTAKSYGKNIQERYGKFKNPLTIDAKGEMYSGGSSNVDMKNVLREAVEKAKKEGNDVVIIKNLSDRKDWGNYEPATHYAVLDVNNLKTKSQLTDIWNQAHKK